ncbi:MAG: dephospho-CoA kinase [Halanaerobiales bacterium]
MIIGLTGGIATGKSTVCKILKDLNINVIDSDQIAHQVLNYEDVIDKVQKIFGNKVIDKDDKIDRKKLGKIVFEDSKKLKILESITHPKIFEIIDQKLEETEDELVVLDAPLLFETSLDDKVDETWVVYASKKTQINRLKERDNLDKQEALNRINAQMDLNKKVKKGDVVINNEGTIQELENKIKKIIEEKN